MVLAAPAAGAHGAEVRLVDPSPAHGALIATQPVPYSVAFGWSRDTTGCAAPATAVATFHIFGPNGFSDSLTSTSPQSDAATFTATAVRPTGYTWFVEMTCGAITVRSEMRRFTLQGPNLEPRLKGRYLVTVGGNRQIWRFAPRCAKGACRTLARRPGSNWFTLRWNPKTRTYTGRIRRVKITKERVCRITTRRGGRVISRRTVRKAYGAKGVTVRLKVRQTRLNAAGTVTFAYRLRGSHRTKYLPTARGRKLGCPPSPVIGAKAVATRR
jgi:hypothetical protein